MTSSLPGPAGDEAADTKIKRVPLPPLDFRCPYCPLCDRETYHEDETFCCDQCGVVWPTDHGEPGESYDPDADQCDSEVQPWAGNTDHPQIAGHRYRCVLDLGHEGEQHAGVRSDREVEHHWSVGADVFSWREGRYPRIDDIVADSEWVASR